MSKTDDPVVIHKQQTWEEAGVAIYVDQRGLFVATVEEGQSVSGETLQACRTRVKNVVLKLRDRRKFEAPLVHFSIQGGTYGHDFNVTATRGTYRGVHGRGGFLWTGPKGAKKHVTHYNGDTFLARPDTEELEELEALIAAHRQAAAITEERREAVKTRFDELAADGLVMVRGRLAGSANSPEQAFHASRKLDAWIQGEDAWEPGPDAMVDDEVDYSDDWDDDEGVFDG